MYYNNLSLLFFSCYQKLTKFSEISSISTTKSRHKGSSLTWSSHRGFNDWLLFIDRLLLFFFYLLLADKKPLRLNPQLAVLMQPDMNGFLFLTQDSFPWREALKTKAQQIDCLLCHCAFHLPNQFFCALYNTCGSTSGRELTACFCLLVYGAVLHMLDEASLTTLTKRFSRLPSWLAKLFVLGFSHRLSESSVQEVNVKWLSLAAVLT